MNPTLSDLERLARQAGEILRAGYSREHQIDYKGEIDLVTEVDRQSEAFLLGEIQRDFPGHRIVSEEIGVIPGQGGEQWLVDPLDGTVNYAHGVPFFTVSIAFAREGQIRLGAVYEPLRDELFLAERGAGAALNGQPIHASAAGELDKSLLVTGFPYDIRTTRNNNLDLYARFALVSQGVRRLGSASLDLCYVAAGRMDGYWELSLKPWDVAAGGLIAQEAGARTTTIDGKPDYLVPPCSLLAAPVELHARMLKILSEKP